MATTAQARPLERRETSNLIGSDKVEGTPVCRPDGERVGQIERIMIDKLSGKVAYAVMSFGGFLGIGEDYYPLPWSVLTYNPTLGGYEINVTEQQLKNAPKYSRHESWDWLTAHERRRLATSTVFDRNPLGFVQGEEQKGRNNMRTLSRLMIAAGVLGTIAGTGVAPALAQGVYFEGPGFGVGIGRPAYRERHYYRGYSDYDSPRFYSERRYHRGPQMYERHSYRWRDRDWD